MAEAYGWLVADGWLMANGSADDRQRLAIRPFQPSAISH
jgi:hypothetical protein